jgi:Fibronectin type III domain
MSSAVAVKQGVTLAFRSPTTDGGATVKRTAAKSPISIAGMSVKRHYTCVVAARNSVGVGPASKPSSTIVPLAQDEHQLPGAPATVHVRADVGSIYVTYARVPSAPTGQRLFVKRYRAKCASSNGGVSHREERSWTRPGIEVKHLTAAKTYRCTVSARNSNGWGPFSAPSDPVVPR